MCKDKKTRRFIIAMIFYLIAIGVARVECFYGNMTLNFYTLVGAPIVFPIYYCLIATSLEEHKIWPLVALSCYFTVMGVLDARYGSDEIIMICELLEVSLFVIQITVAIFVSLIDTKNVSKK